LQEELQPEAVLARLAGGDAETVALPDLASLDSGYAVWWTDGSPFVPPACVARAGLPDAAAFAGMIDAGLGMMRAETDNSERAGETNE
jgi:hypothetical protein